VCHRVYTAIMSTQVAKKILKNPFIGTHTRRLVAETVGSVASFIRKGAKARRSAKSLFDYAFMYDNLAVGKKFQKKSWRLLEQDPLHPTHYWLVTRVVAKARHPQRRHGNAWGVLFWNGKPWNHGEERPINGAGTKKWYMCGIPQVPAPKLIVDPSKFSDLSHEEEEL